MNIFVCISLMLLMPMPLTGACAYAFKYENLNMVIQTQPLRPYRDLESYEKDATVRYFGKTDDVELCARFILTSPTDGKQKATSCEYVPVNTILHKETITTTLYKLTLVADQYGNKPQDMIEKLCKLYTQSSQKKSATSDF